ncbi:MAG: FxLYD domain-containing protein [Coprobacillus sp.]
MKKLPKWALVLIVIVVIGVAGSAMSGGSSKKGSTAQGTTEEKKEDFTIEGKTTGAYDSSKFAYYIEGTIKNNTDEDKSYVQVTFNLFDKEGNQLGTAMTNINDLKAGGTWKFKAMGMKKDIAKYELSEITGH